MEQYQSKYTGKEIENKLDSISELVENPILNGGTILDLRQVQRKFFTKAPSIILLRNRNQTVNFVSAFLNENNTQPSHQLENYFYSLNIDWKLIDKIIISVSTDAESPLPFDDEYVIDMVLSKIFNDSNDSGLLLDSTGKFTNINLSFEYCFHLYHEFLSLMLIGSGVDLFSFRINCINKASVVAN